jgi:ABC exporter DevB family membrane fusion protein
VAVSAQKPVAPVAVSARGYLEPEGEVIKVSAPAFMEGARVDKLLVQRGDRVKVDQVIAILDSRDRLQAALIQAQAQIGISASRLAQVKAGAKQGDIIAQDARFARTKAELEGQLAIQRATIASLEAQQRGEKAAQQATIERIRAEVVNAQTDCRRYQTLHADGAVSEQERDRFCLQAKTTDKSLKEAEANLKRIITTMDENIKEARANLRRTILTLDQQIKESQATLASVEEVRPVDVQAAEAELLSSQAAVQRAEAELALASVKAPKSGQILKIHTWPGELVSNDGIVDLGQTNQMYVTAEVYETDISRVKLGQIARIKTNDIIGDLEGTVDEIGLQIGRQDVLGTDPAADADARVVEVKIRLNPQSSEKVAGLTNLEVNLVIDTPDN